MKKAIALLFVLAAALLVAALSASPSSALSGGVSGLSGNPATNLGDSCGSCHGAGSTPIVVLNGPTLVAPNSVNTYVLGVQSTNVAAQTAAGLDVSATAGLLASLGLDTQILDGEVTHTAPKVNDAGGLATFTFQWTAPETGSQTVTLYAAGNSVNQDGIPFGDAHHNTSLVIEVAEPSAVKLSNLAAERTSNGLEIISLGGVLLLLAAGLGGWRRLAR
jgi:hypothetical protein